MPSADAQSAPILQRRRKTSCGSQLIEPSLVARSVLLTALFRGSAPAPAADFASAAPPATPAAPAAHPDRLLDGHFRSRRMALAHHKMALAHHKRCGLGRNGNQGQTGSGNGGTAHQDPQPGILQMDHNLHASRQTITLVLSHPLFRGRHYGFWQPLAA
jgi:hypothetical protein